MSCQTNFTCGPSVAYGSLTCSNAPTYVQDQVCSDINITPITTGAFSTDIYRSNLNPSRLYVSGFISITDAPLNRTITVNFRLGGPTGTIVETDTILPGTSLAFNKTGFDTIELVVGAGEDLTPNVTGQICVTSRYAVN
jgi:hypothetical protein